MDVQFVLEHPKYSIAFCLLKNLCLIFHLFASPQGDMVGSKMQQETEEMGKLSLSTVQPL
jgi:hypothetical protein